MRPAKTLKRNRTPEGFEFFEISNLRARPTLHFTITLTTTTAATLLTYTPLSLPIPFPFSFLFIRTMLSRHAILRRPANVASILPRLAIAPRFASFLSSPARFEDLTRSADPRLAPAVPLHLLQPMDLPALSLSHSGAAISAQSNSDKDPASDADKTPDQTPTKPKQEKKEREPAEKEPSKNTNTTTKSSSSSDSSEPNQSSAPPNNDSNNNNDDPPAPKYDPNPNLPEMLYQFASAADKKQVMILPINKRPLIPGMFLLICFSQHDKTAQMY